MRSLEGHHVSSKNPSKVPDRNEGVAGRSGTRKHKIVLPRQGVIDLPSLQFNDFLPLAMAGQVLLNLLLVVFDLVGTLLSQTP